MGKITRRNFINGTLVAAGAGTIERLSSSQMVMAALQPDYYPPARTGLRGSHPGSNDHAHKLAWSGHADWGSTTNLDKTYDLVVVGGGLSGLAAAYFFLNKHGRDKKVLILENHDDFGGHAKRNEHTIDGHLRIGQGGSESFEDPHGWSAVPRELMLELGVDSAAFENAYDTNFYRRHQLGAVTYFNSRNFGVDKIVKHPFCDYPGFVEGLLRPTLSYEEAVAQTPLTSKGKEQLLRILTVNQATLGMSREELRERAQTQPYFDFLRNTLQIDDPAVLQMARSTAMDYAGVGTDALTLGEALISGSLGGDPYDSWGDVVAPGDYQEYIKKDGPTYAVRHPFIQHYPDGNATIARMLVKRMIPQVGPGSIAADMVLSRFDYAELDKPDNSAQIRLNSTVVQVTHSGDPALSNEVIVKYIQDNHAYQIKGKGVVLACYNMMIPHIVPDLPDDQDAALRALSKVSLQYTTVGMKNWRGVKEAGIGLAMCPGNIHQVVGMDYPVSIGGYEYTKTPDDPCVLHMRSCPLGDSVGATRRQQVREARYKMLAMQFKDYEQELREHLTGMLPATEFEFDRDVASISINRWAHAYVLGNPGDIGRRRFGRIAIANSDASGSSLMNTAIEQAWRAVEELG